MSFTSNIKKQIQITGLYIHIPFCVKKCGYCDFAVHAQGSDFSGHNNPNTELQLRYLNSLNNEFRMYTQHKEAIYDFSDLRTIYIGGGTPSLLTDSNIKFLADIIKQNIPNY